MVELTFGRCNDPKLVMNFRPGFILEKGRLGAAIRNGWTKNFEIKFFGYLKLNFFWLSSFVPEEFPVDQKLYCFSDRMNLVLQVYVGFLRG